MRDFTIEEIREIITIDFSRNDLLTDFGKATLKDRYCLPDEDYQDVFARAAVAFCGADYDLAQRLYDYSSKLWFMFATPLITNGGTSRGLPISCFLNYVPDSIKGLTDNFVENAFLATRGGGIGSYWGNVRSIGQKSSRGVETPGAIQFMGCIDKQMLAYHQGSTRRGAAATYMDMTHPEIIDFIDMRKHTEGDIHRKNENLHHGVCISDNFMIAVENDQQWDLIDPNSKEVVETVPARKLWIRLLETRLEKGEPYLFFKDTAQRHLPKSQRDQGLTVHHSNLCTEITLATNEDRTAVCCLSSLNVSKFREWEPVREQLIKDLITMLDNTLEVFINDAPDELWRARNSALMERSLGLGTLGFHTLLQQEGMCYGSKEAEEFNKELYRMIKMHAVDRSKELAGVRGEAPDMIGTGMRHAHLLAVAPNASSSVICGTVSPSIEPLTANAFAQKTLSGTFEVRNPALVPTLEKYNKNTPQVWSSIIINKGSVQHLAFLSEYEKNLFKTAIELDQIHTINLAADRQEFICQAQSVNLYFPADVHVKVLNKMHVKAWKVGLKSLYYLRSESVKSTETINELIDNEIEVPKRKPTMDCTDDVCVACEG